MSRDRGLVALAGLTAALVLFGIFGNRALLSVATTMLMYLLLVQGWSLLGGYAGYLSLATSGFFGIGAYTSAILAPHLPWHFVLTPLIAAGIAGLLALAVAPPALRLRGAYFVIFSLIFGFVIQSLARNSELTRGALGIFAPVLPFDAVTTVRVWYAAFLLLGIAATLAVYLVQRSRLGDALVAIREDEDAAVVLGVRVNALKYAAFAAGAGMAALAGALQAYRLNYIEPAGVLSLEVALNVLIMGVVGGLGRWHGPLIGVPVVLGLAEMLRVGVTRLPETLRLPAESNRIVLGILVVVIALYARNGLAGLLSNPRGNRLDV